jgi:hypothetical protein
MEKGFDVLIVRGFATREGKGKWACCFEIRIPAPAGAQILFRGEVHGRRFLSAEAAVVAAREAGEREAQRRFDALPPRAGGRHDYRIVFDPDASFVGCRPAVQAGRAGAS